MNKLFQTILVSLVLFSGVVTAEPPVRDATLSWVKPSPMFTDGSDGYPGMTIDSYTFEYTGSDGVLNEIIVTGYDTETFVLKDIPPGAFTVRGKSWCSGCSGGMFSAWGNTYATTIVINLTPSSPQIIELLIVPDPVASNRRTFTTSVADVDYAGNCRIKKKGKRINCSGKAQL